MSSMVLSIDMDSASFVIALFQQTGSRKNAWILAMYTTSAVFISAFPEADLKTASNLGPRVCDV